MHMNYASGCGSVLYGMCLLKKKVSVVGWSLCRTASGTFQDGGILLNKEGLRVVSRESTPSVGLFFTCQQCILL